METKMSPLEVVAFAFVEPEYARQEYFKNKQKESGYSVPVFVKKLEDAVKVLSNEAHKNDWRSRSGPGGFEAIPQVNLYDLTKGRYNGSINDTHLFNLLKDIYKAFQETSENNNRPGRFDTMVNLYKSCGERSRTQLLAHAKKLGFVPKSYADYWTKYFDKIKKKATELK